MPQHIKDFIEDKARSDGSYAIAFALLELASAQERTATALTHMGAGTVHGPGAVELIGISIKEGMERLSDAIGELRPD